MTSSKFTHRIPQEVIDDLISRNDIVEVVGRHIKLRREGKDYTALCPFHKENTPSFTVSPDKQFYYCFGCGASGNSMVFLMEYGAQSFLSVIMSMAEDHGVDLSSYLKTASDAQNDLRLVPALSSATEYFHEHLKNSAPQGRVKAYLKERRVPDSIIESFLLGYAEHSQTILKDLEHHTQALISAGVFRDKDGRVYSAFRERLMLPLRDPRGKVVAMTGRTLTDDKPKYLNSAETPLFSRNSVLYGLYESIRMTGKTVMDHLYVVEGQFDVIGCHMAQEPAVAGMGSSLSVHQLRLLLRHCKTCTFLFDGDAAGHKAAIKVCTLLLEHLTDMDNDFNVVTLHHGEDPYSLATKGLEAFREATANPVPWMDALFMLSQEGHDMTTPKGRGRFAAQMIDYIHESRDPLIRHMALEKLSSVTQIPMETLSGRMETLPLSRSGQAMQVKVSNEAAIRFTRMVWDEPCWSDAVPNPNLWADDEDPLIMTLGVWMQQLRSGTYDAEMNKQEREMINAAPANEKDVMVSRRNRGGTMALGRMLSNLSPEIMQSIMQGEPEASASLANALGWHITGQLASKAMQEITRKSALGLMTDEDREQFIVLRNLRQQAVARTRALA